MAQLSDANGKAKEALEQSRASLQRTAEELRQAHPEVEQQAQQLRDKLQAAVKNTVEVILYLMSFTNKSSITFVAKHL